MAFFVLNGMEKEAETGSIFGNPEIAMYFSHCAKYARRCLKNLVYDYFIIFAKLLFKVLFLAVYFFSWCIKSIDTFNF